MRWLDLRCMKRYNYMRCVLSLAAVLIYRYSFIPANRWNWIESLFTPPTVNANFGFSWWSEIPGLDMRGGGRQTMYRWIYSMAWTPLRLLAYGHDCRKSSLSPTSCASILTRRVLSGPVKWVPYQSADLRCAGLFACQMLSTNILWTVKLEEYAKSIWALLSEYLMSRVMSCWRWLLGSLAVWSGVVCRKLDLFKEVHSLLNPGV